MFWNNKKHKSLVEQYREWTDLANFEFDDVKSPKRNALNEENFNTLCEKVDLILEHLKLEYVPEQYRTEPAKLTEQRVWSMSDTLSKIAEYSAQHYVNSVVSDTKKKLTPKKKSKKTK
jgi:hypothetical protein